MYLFDNDNTSDDLDEARTTVRIDDDRSVWITHHRVTDIQAAGLLASTSDGGAMVDRLLALGATLATQLDSLGLVQLLDERVDALEQTITAAGEQLDRQAHASVTAMAAQLSDHLHRLEHSLAVDHLDSPAGQLAGQLGGRLDRVVDDVLTRLSGGEHTPLVTVERELQAMRVDISGLRDRLVEHAAKAEMTAITPRKGFVFEDAFEIELNAMGKILGDTVARVGTTREAGSSNQAGDFLTRVSLVETAGVDARISLELKHRKMSLAELRRELARCRENRGALVSVCVMANASQAPTCVVPMGEVTPVDLVCIYDPNDPTALHLTYRYARLLALSMIRVSDSDEVPVAEITSAFTQIRTRLGGIRQIKTTLTKMEKAVAQGADAAKADLDGLQADIDGEMSKLQARLVQPDDAESQKGTST